MPPYRPSSGDKAHLGDGPVGSYWRYRDVETKEVVAVKRIDPGTPMDVEAVDQYLKDLKTKPHNHVIGPICAWYEDLEGDPYHFIAFPFQSAGSLYDLLTTMETLGIDLVRSYMKQATEGVNHIHTNIGRQHGDIKLQNILFTNKERTQVALSDFGLVLPDDVDSDLKKSVITGGTVEYLAPEVLDKQIMGKAQDIWAIGVVTYVCLCGKFPFEFMKAKEMRERVSKQLESHTLKDLEEADNPFALAADIFTEDAMEKIKKGLPDEMEFEMAKDFVGKLMDIDYKERITAEDALAHQFLDVENTSIKPNVPEAATPSANSTISSKHKKSRRSREGKDHAGPSKGHSKSGSTARKGGKAVRFVSDVKFMKSEFSPKIFETIGSHLRGGNGSVESDINLKGWKRYKEVLVNLPAKINWLLFLSLKAGFVFNKGKFEFALNPRQLTEKDLKYLERLAAVDASSIGGSSSHHHSTATVERPRSRRSRSSRHSTSQRAPSLPPVVEEEGEANGAPAPTEQGPLHGAASQHQGMGDSPPPNQPTAVEKLPEQTPHLPSEHGKSPSGSQRGGSGAGKADGRKQPYPAPGVKGQKANDHTPSPDPKNPSPPKETDPPQPGKAGSKHSSRAPTIIEEAPKSGPTPPPAERTDTPPAASGDPPPPEKFALAGSPTPSRIALPSSKASSVISKESRRSEKAGKQRSVPRKVTRTESPTPSQTPLPPSKASSVIATDIDPQHVMHHQATVESTSEFSGDGENLECWTTKSKTRSGKEPDTESVHSQKSRHHKISSPASIRSLASEKRKTAAPKKGSRAPSVASAKDVSPVAEDKQKKEKLRSSTKKSARTRTRRSHSKRADKKHEKAVKFAEQEKSEEKEKKDPPPAGNAETTRAEQQTDAGPSMDSKSDEQPGKGKQKEQSVEPEPKSRTETTGDYNYGFKSNIQKLKDPIEKAKKHRAKMEKRIREAIESSRMPPGEWRPPRSWTPTTESDALSLQSKGSRRSKGKK